jgi:hypothetical protein
MDSSVITGDRKLSVEKWAKKKGIGGEFAGSLAKSVREPEETSYLLDSIIKSFSDLKSGSKKEVRNSLLRVQIHCSINSDSDPIKVSKQLFVAQVLEKLLFGCNILFGEEIDIEEHPAAKKGK